MKSKGKITESGKVTGILTVLVPEKDNLAVFGERERERSDKIDYVLMDFLPELESH